jgi:hypothetical protein
LQGLKIRAYIRPYILRREGEREVKVYLKIYIRKKKVIQCSSLQQRFRTHVMLRRQKRRQRHLHSLERRVRRYKSSFKKKRMQGLYRLGR